MRRADRLFQIIQYLRTRRVTTARWLSEQLEVSERTIYRDIQDLMASGVPIDGEPGIGYVIRKSFDLPPLMFSEEEICALALGASIVRSWADPQLANAAQSVLSKIQSVLPEELKPSIESQEMISPMVLVHPQVAKQLSTLRQCMQDRSKATLTYRDSQTNPTIRLVWPLGLFFWGATWTLAAWCELRGAFRSFRVDRIESLCVEAEQFPQEPGKTLRDLIEFEQKQAENCQTSLAKP